MRKKLFEEISFKKGKLGDWDVLYLFTDNDDENKIVWDNYQTLKKDYGINYNSKPGVKKLFWFLDKNDENKTFQKIKSALNFLNSKTINTPQADKLVKDIDKIIQNIKDFNPSNNPELKLTKDEEDEIQNKLNEFKNMLVNIDNDEDFKTTMSKLLSFKAAQGYKYSFGNTILIYIQNPKATIVNSKKNWLEKYNRTVNKNAKPIMVWAPQGTGTKKSKEEKEKIEDDFLKSVNKKSYAELTPNEKIRLDTLLMDTKSTSRFVFAPVFDVSDTTQIEGTEDYIEKAKSGKKDIKWFEENKLSDEVRPIYTALMDFCQEKGIKIELNSDLGGSRGSSASGVIKLLKNEGNDVGLTKTLAHEITHELLHQKYLLNKGDETAKYYIGKGITRQTIEQQAELSAWMFMYSFGFDVKKTSLNYTILWGGDKENMVSVFDTVTGVVNHLIDYVNKKLTTLTETKGIPLHGNKITPYEIAELLGVEKEYKEIKQKEQIKESLRKKLLR